MKFLFIAQLVVFAYKTLKEKNLKCALLHHYLASLVPYKIKSDNFVVQLHVSML